MLICCTTFQRWEGCKILKPSLMWRVPNLFLFSEFSFQQLLDTKCINIHFQKLRSIVCMCVYVCAVSPFAIWMPYPTFDNLGIKVYLLTLVEKSSHLIFMCAFPMKFSTSALIFQSSQMSKTTKKIGILVIEVWRHEIIRGWKSFTTILYINDNMNKDSQHH